MRKSALLSRWVGALVASLILWACGDSQNEYTVGTAFFVFDNSTHQNFVLSSAMNANSPGVFCKVQRTVKAGAPYFEFENNQGQAESSVVNAVDQQLTCILGYNNSLIVGYGNLDMPPVFYAYDGECPNCFDPRAIPMRSRPLTMTSAGLAVCATCHREYNMNSGGNIVKGDGGNKLTRYHATCTGPLGRLAVR